MSKLVESIEGKAMNKEQNLKSASSRKHAYLHKKFMLSCEPMNVSQLIYSVR